MKKWLIPLIIIGVLIFVIGSWIAGINNTAVQYDENAIQAWANVESAYQRRTDLIPNLVNTVKGAADFEQSTLTDVIEARAKATQVKIDPANLTPEKIAEFQQAQSGVSSALSRLLVTVERYPELKATDNFKELQSQLESTENRINVERNRYNETVNTYNRHVRIFPNSLVAGMLGFDKKTPFEAAEGAEDAPEVEFDFQN